MTNQRVCDACGKIIEKGKDYCKFQWVKHEGKRLDYIGIGHCCLGCLPGKINTQHLKGGKQPRP